MAIQLQTSSHVERGQMSLNSHIAARVGAPRQGHGQQGISGLAHIVAASAASRQKCRILLTIASPDTGSGRRIRDMAALPEQVGGRPQPAVGKGYRLR